MNIREAKETLAQTGFQHLTIIKVGYFYHLSDSRLTALGIPQIYLFAGSNNRSINKVVAGAAKGRIPVPSPLATPEQLEIAKQLYTPGVWTKIEAWHAKSPVRLAMLAERKTGAVIEMDNGEKFL